jgi:hypothetical protein
MGEATPKNDAVAVIRLVAEFVQELSSSQLDDLLTGRSKLAIKPAGSGSERGAQRRKPAPSKEEIRTALDRLYSIQSREEGEKLLEERFSSRAALEALARYADLPVQSRDTVQSLRNRIIESTIGYRLRSRAIQGRADTAQRTQSTDA